MPHVREASVADIPRLQQIRAAVRENQLRTPGRVTTADYEAHIHGRGRTWVAELAGQVLGFSSADGDTATIWALFVDPEHEGRGLGRLLLAPALAWLWARGAAEVGLDTAPGTRAERFYRAGGWTCTGTTRHGELTFSLRRPADAPTVHG